MKLFCTNPVAMQQLQLNHRPSDYPIAISPARLLQYKTFANYGKHRARLNADFQLRRLIRGTPLLEGAAVIAGVLIARLRLCVRTMSGEFTQANRCRCFPVCFHYRVHLVQVG